MRIWISAAMAIAILVGAVATTRSLFPTEHASVPSTQREKASAALEARIRRLEEDLRRWPSPNAIRVDLDGLAGQVSRRIQEENEEASRTAPYDDEAERPRPSTTDRVQAYERVLSANGRDSDLEAQIFDEVDRGNALEGAELLSAECAASTCRLELGHHDRPLEDLYMALPAIVPSGSHLSLVPVMDGDARVGTTAFVTVGGPVQ